MKLGFVLLAPVVSLGFISLAPAQSATTESTNVGSPQYFPAFGSTDVCVDTPLRITFPSEPKLGESGSVKIIDASTHQAVETIDLANQTTTIGGVDDFHVHPAITEGNTVTFYPHGSLLEYGKQYSVELDTTLLESTRLQRENIAKWTFTTKSKSPDAKTDKITVATDNSGDFCTVQAALDFIPDGNPTPRTIFVRSGAYNEIICFRGKNNLKIEGEDRKNAVIQYANNNKFNSGSGGGLYRRGVLEAANCTNLTIQNLTIRNTTPRGGTQAEAIILRGGNQSKQIVSNVDLYSFQDTLQINGQAYISNTYVEGDVDFLWGGGPCFFENCEFKATRSQGYFTQIRNRAGVHGYVFDKCKFETSEGINDVYLSRIAPSSFPASEVVLIDCTLDGINPVGWLLNGPSGKSASQPDIGSTQDLHFWEANSRDAQGNPIDASQRLNVSKQLASPSDAQTISHYSDPKFVLGGWDPKAK